MTTPPNSEPPNEPPSREAVEAAMRMANSLPLSWEDTKHITAHFPNRPGRKLQWHGVRILAAEVQRLRALVDELTAPEPSRGMSLCAADFDIMESAGTTVTIQRKQIKLGPDKPKPDYEMYCAACGQPSPTSHWFGKGHIAMCPQCAAEYVCNAGRER